jgi:hypothetical protein
MVSWNKGKEGLKGELNGNYGNPTGFSGNKTSYKKGKEHVMYGKKQTEELINKRMSNMPWELMNKKKKKPILQYSKDGVFVKEWEGMVDIINHFQISKNIVRHRIENGIEISGFIFKRKQM